MAILGFRREARVKFCFGKVAQGETGVLAQD